MAKLVDSSFTSWELTEREQLEGCVLNHFQKMLIQNDLASTAELLLGLTFDTTKPYDMIAQHADLTGQKVILQMLLERSESAQVTLQQLAQNQTN